MQVGHLGKHSPVHVRCNRSSHCESQQAPFFISPAPKPHSHSHIIQITRFITNFRKMRSAVAVVVLVAMLSVPAFSAPTDGGAPGGWNKVPATDPAVKKATAYLLKIINSGNTPFLTDRNGTGQSWQKKPLPFRDVSTGISLLPVFCMSGQAFYSPKALRPVPVSASLQQPVNDRNPGSTCPFRTNSFACAQAPMLPQHRPAPVPAQRNHGLPPEITLAPVLLPLPSIPSSQPRHLYPHMSFPPSHLKCGISHKPLGHLGPLT